MSHKYYFEALDRSLMVIMSTFNNSDSFFGGKVIVFGGGFKKILSVNLGGGRSDIVHSAINSLYIWDQCQVLTLTKNMRIQGGTKNMNVMKYNYSPNGF